MSKYIKINKDTFKNLEFDIKIDLKESRPMTEREKEAREQMEKDIIDLLKAQKKGINNENKLCL